MSCFDIHNFFVVEHFDERSDEFFPCIDKILHFGLVSRIGSQEFLPGCSFCYVSGNCQTVADYEIVVSEVG